MKVKLVAGNRFPVIAFGCVQYGQGSAFKQLSGIVGFGRGPKSLVSQLGPIMENKFSYCLVSVTDSPSETSPLLLGHTASLKAVTFGSTPILQNTYHPDYYYLSLERISVGGQSLDIPAGTFDIQFDGSGGLVIDSGTTISFLPQTAYDALKKALGSSINFPRIDGSSVGLDFCFQPVISTNSTYPSLTFHFKGADYNLPTDNYLVAREDGNGNLDFFLAMLPNVSDDDISIFGNIQQQSYQIIYDNDNNVLSFAPTVCELL